MIVKYPTSLLSTDVIKLIWARAVNPVPFLWNSQTHCKMHSTAVGLLLTVEAYGHDPALQTQMGLVS